MAKRKKRAPIRKTRPRLTRTTKVDKLREILAECDEETLAGPIDGLEALCRKHRLDIAQPTIYGERRKMLSKVNTEGTQEGTLLNDLLEVKRMANRVGGLQVLKSRISTLEKLT
jgi:hypothetical protein